MLRNSAVSFAEDEKVEVVTNRPFVALRRSRLPKNPELPQGRCCCLLRSAGLDVDAIKPEGVLINHTVNTVVAAAAEQQIASLRPPAFVQGQRLCRTAHPHPTAEPSWIRHVETIEQLRAFLAFKYTYNGGPTNRASPATKTGLQAR